MISADRETLGTRNDIDANAGTRARDPRTHRPTSRDYIIYATGLTSLELCVYRQTVRN